MKLRTIYITKAVYSFGTVINHFKPSEFHMIKKILTSDSLTNIPVTITKEEVPQSMYNSIFE